jgi:hypothetical protein
MAEQGNPLSRNPNICASCSSLADGMEETATHEMVQLSSGLEVASGSIEVSNADRTADKAA